MSQTLTLELPDEVYTAVKRTAEANGKTPAEWAMETLRQRLPATDGETAENGRSLREQFALEQWEVFEKVAARYGRKIEELALEWIGKYRRSTLRHSARCGRH